MMKSAIALFVAAALALLACAPKPLTPCAKSESRNFCPITLLHSPPPPHMCVTEQTFVMTTCSKTNTLPAGALPIDSVLPSVFLACPPIS